VSGPEYLDVSVPKGSTFSHPTQPDHTVFAYVFEGEAEVGGNSFGEGSLVHFGPGSSVVVSAGKRAARFLLVSGPPLKEPVAWYGPIVMNTQDELRTAFKEFQDGTFVKRGK
jgi:quercetin 2,3-dioxygenase